MTATPTSLSAGQVLPEHRVLARNGAAQSENKIHDDTVARQYGFAGGLVPGVTVWAYMVPPVFKALGPEWARSGRLFGRFLKPVYEGEEAVVHTTVASMENGVTTLDIEVRNPAGELCAVGQAQMGHDFATVDVSEYPVAPLPSEREPVSEQVLVGFDVMGTVKGENSHENLEKFLHEADDRLDDWLADGAPSHPGMVARLANACLAQNVRLNPWIHVSSDAQFFDVLRPGEEYFGRSRRVELFERKGHRFVRLDIVIVGEDERPIMRIDHTAIYDIRKVGDAGE
jgi:hypothetical protein